MSDKPGCLTIIIQEILGIGPKETAESYPYQPQKSILTDAELSFYHVLTTALNGKLTTCVQVPLVSLIYPKTGSHKQNNTYRNKIDRKRVDFVLCDPQTLRPMLVIELDDSSHQRASRQTRDTFVEKALEAAKIPIMRVKTQATYPPRELLLEIKEKLNTYQPFPSTTN